MPTSTRNNCFESSLHLTISQLLSVVERTIFISHRFSSNYVIINFSTLLCVCFSLTIVFALSFITVFITSYHPFGYRGCWYTFENLAMSGIEFILVRILNYSVFALLSSILTASSQVCSWFVCLFINCSIFVCLQSLTVMVLVFLCCLIIPHALLFSKLEIVCED